MRTEEEIRIQVDKIKAQLMRDDTIDAVKYHQGYVTALEWSLEMFERDGFGT